MDNEQVELYQRIQSFELDATEAQWPFSKKLAAENRWSDLYTRRVIEEYKKFTFLAVAAGHPVSPSDQVDQAWHLHLNFSRSYWNEFCANVLGKPLHHEPSLGGAAEKSKFIDMYGKTLASYERLFGEQPPEDIWPAPASRFSRDTHYIRVNAKQHWLLPKPMHWRLVGGRGAALLSLLSISVFMASCAGTPEGVILLKLNGNSFLILYIFVNLLLMLPLMFIRSIMRIPNGDGKPLELDLSTEELAYLSGGTGQAVDVALLNLFQRGCIKLDTGQSSIGGLVKGTPIVRLVNENGARSPLEDAVLKQAALPDAKLNTIRSKVETKAYALRTRLETLGLYVQRTQSFKALGTNLLLFSPLLALGGLRVVHGMEMGKPVGYLIVLIVITLLILIFGSFPGLSNYGNLVLAHEKGKLPDKRTDEGLLQAVALAGLTVLTGTALADVQTALIDSKKAVSGGADGGGGDGGGCGGCGGD